MNIKTSIICLLALLLAQCAPNHNQDANSLLGLAQNLESIAGRSNYLNSPYMTGGNRLYVVGHQNGTFPDLGWHVTGEMGGIWDHPIKLMDGYAASIETEGQSHCLNEASTYRNYPIASEQLFDLKDAGLEVRAVQFVPDNREGLVIEYNINNTSKKPFIGSFSFTGLVDLRPVWLGERTGMEDGDDAATYRNDLRGFSAKDNNNDWYTVFAGDAAPIDNTTGSYSCQFERKGKGGNATLTYPIDLEGNSVHVLRFYIAGSYESEARAIETLNDLKNNPLPYFKDKMERYRQIEERAQLKIPDQEVETLYRWIKYSNDWLIREVPEVGRGIAAGIPDYPWWFGVDQAYTIQGMLAIGEHELAEDILRLMYKLSEKENKGNGRIVHEVSTNGAVFNPGTVQETPLYAIAAWDYFCWTGDLDLLKSAYDIAGRGLNWLMSQDKDGNGYPDGYGIMEIHGLDTEMIDVVVYTQQAFAVAAKMAAVLGDPENEAIYGAKAEQLASKINDEWWVEEANSYADFRARPEKAKHLLEEAIHRADTLAKPWSKTELEATLHAMEASNSTAVTGYAFYHNWVVNTPLEVGIADPDKAKRALETARLYTNQYGVYVTGIDREEVQETSDESFADSKKEEGFNYVGAVMTLPTGVQAISESRYGQADEALKYLKMLVNSFSYAAPGSMYEVSPDYGMLVQAWNIYGVAVPVVKRFFGVTPMAHEKQIKISPDMPSSWNNASLSELPVGDNKISIRRERQENTITYTVEQIRLDWEITFVVPDEAEGAVTFNGAAITPEGGQITSDGSTLVITYQVL